MIQKKVIILGAGLAGLSAAWHLKKKGIDCQVFEKEKQIGGLCRSKNINGFTFDYDGHLLHFRHKTTYDFIKNSLGLKLICHKRNSCVRYLGIDIPYPFQANFLKLPAEIADECLNGLKMVQGNLKRGYNNFHEWIYVSFGKGIARHFMLPYNEKFWTAPLSDITCQWLDGFVPVLTFNDIVNKSSRYLRSLGYNTYFYYPESAGIEELPFALGEYIKSDISLRSEVTGIDIKNRTVMINNRQIVHYSNLVSTLPLPELKNIIKDIPKKISNFIDVLNYNSIVVFNIGVKAMLHHIDKHWIYFPEKKNRYFRVGFYSSFSKALTPPLCSSMYAEVSYHKDKRINMAELEKEVISDLSREGIISSPKDVVCNNIINIKYGYPIYDQNYSVAVSNILKFLSSYGIYSIGRYGRWKYMTMEDVLMDGEKTAGVF